VINNLGYEAGASIDYAFVIHFSIKTPVQYNSLKIGEWYKSLS
jgi:hypothetical protein